MAKNPCRVPGADQEKPAERPVLSVARALRLADAVPDRHRALILVATFGCLRWGEVAGLERQDVDEVAGGGAAASDEVRPDDDDDGTADALVPVG